MRGHQGRIRWTELPRALLAACARGCSIRLEGVARYQWDCAVTKDAARRERVFQFGGRSCRGRCSRRAPSAPQFGLGAAGGNSEMARAAIRQPDHRRRRRWRNCEAGIAAWALKGERPESVARALRMRSATQANAELVRAWGVLCLERQTVGNASDLAEDSDAQSVRVGRRGACRPREQG